jgi:hypothetical protein
MTTHKKEANEALPTNPAPATEGGVEDQPNPGDPGAPILEPRVPQAPRPEGVPLRGDPPVGY